MSSTRAASSYRSSGAYYNRRKYNGPSTRGAEQGTTPTTVGSFLNKSYGRKAYAARKFYRPTKGRIAKWATGKSGYKKQAMAVRVLEPAISQCAKEWMASLLNPFSGPEACNPYAPPLYTQRMRSITETSITATGCTPNGTGNTVVIACRWGIASDLATIVISGNSGWSDASHFTAAVNDVFNDSTQVPPSNVPFQASDYTGSAMSWTPVSLGLRFQFICPATQFGGVVTLHETAGHTGIVNNAILSLGQIRSDVRSRKMSIKPGWNSMVWTGPQNQYETQYNASAAVETFPNMSSLIMIIDLPSAASTFNMNINIQAYTNWEAIGDKANQCKYSIQDIPGAGKVEQTLQSFTGGGAVNPDNYYTKVMSGMSYAHKNITPYVRMANNAYDAWNGYRGPE